MPAGWWEAWIAIGLTVGAALNWIIVAPRLREQTERLGDALTIPQYLANRFPESGTLLRVISAVIIVGFFTVYTASGMVGGRQAVCDGLAGVLPDTGLSDYMLGIFITAGIVLIYTMIGGFLAVSLTDFVQGMIMMVALVVMPLVVMFGPGGSAGGHPRCAARRVPEPHPRRDRPRHHQRGHVGPRIFRPTAYHCALHGDRPGGERRPRRGDRDELDDHLASRRGGRDLAGRAYAERNGLVVEDADDLHHPCQSAVPPAVTGFLYAALLAAIMSTISSQLLVSSSSLTEDFLPPVPAPQCLRGGSGGGDIGRLSVALVAAAGMVIAADPESEVLGLVSNAWAGFGAAFGLPADPAGADVEPHDRRGRGRRIGDGRRRGRGVDRAGLEQGLPRRPRPLRDCPGLCRVAAGRSCW